MNGQNEVYYYDPQTGAMVHGEQKIDGHWHYFNPNYDGNANPSDQNDYHVMTIVGYRNGQFLIANPCSYSRRFYWVNQGTWNYVNKNEHANGWNLPTGMNLTV